MWQIWNIYQSRFWKLSNITFFQPLSYKIFHLQCFSTGFTHCSMKAWFFGHPRICGHVCDQPFTGSPSRVRNTDRGINWARNSWVQPLRSILKRSASIETILHKQLLAVFISPLASFWVWINLIALVNIPCCCFIPNLQAFGRHEGKSSYKYVYLQLISSIYHQQPCFWSNRKFSCPALGSMLQGNNYGWFGAINK